MDQNRGELRSMRDLSFRMKSDLENNRPIQKIGELMHEGWEIKRSLARGISDSQIDKWYQIARSEGAWGGKILGAGGGGFLLVLADPSRFSRIRAAMTPLKAMQVKFEPFGSRIIFVG